MNAKDLTLNIAVNLDRISRFSQDGRVGRVHQFTKETEVYLDLLEKTPQKKAFKPTFITFSQQFRAAKSDLANPNQAEWALTWANILTHRSQLA